MPTPRKPKVGDFVKVTYEDCPPDRGTIAKKRTHYACIQFENGSYNWIPWCKISVEIPVEQA